MKLIEALKKKKDILKKAEDYRKKIQQHSALFEHETAPYGTVEQQKAKIKEWLQGHFDLMKEYAELAIRIQKTNLETKVKIELGGEQVKKSIAEWVIRRRELAHLDFEAWSNLTDRGLKEEKTRQSDGQILEKKIVRFFDATERDKKAELYRSEASTIDAQLEVVNAVTEVL